MGSLIEPGEWNHADRCWGCASDDSPRIWFGTYKDLTSLGVLAEGCATTIPLCLDCAVSYMNSFSDWRFV